MFFESSEHETLTTLDIGKGVNETDQYSVSDF